MQALSGSAARRSRRLQRCAATAAFVLGIGVLPLAGTAWAADPCTAPDSSGTVTCSYAFTGGEQPFTVPAGVIQVQVVAVGAAGGQSRLSDPPSRGARVSGTLTGLTGGQTLYVEVGGTPTIAGNCAPRAACAGGFNGGGSNETFGGGGGGASDVRTQSSTVAGSLASRLLVAGGGGGTATFAGQCPSQLLRGGAGGDAGDAGAPGQVCPGLTATSTGGGAGTGSAGGAGGTTTVNGRLTDTGGAGTAGAGGNAGQYGGAGGGGLFGGGSGARTGTTFDDSGSTDYVSAGGGGGGSSLVPTGGSTALVGDPASITITYTIIDYCTAPDSGGTVTCSYAFTGGEQPFTVPAGVIQVQVVAVGAAGGQSRLSDPPSRGARVSGTLTGLTGGQTLYVEVGGTPTIAGNCAPRAACAGGFNGGGSNETFGGGGGGASDVRTQSSTVAGSLASRLLVAGGGGGTATFAGQCPSQLLRGGAGGDAGDAGAPGQVCPGLTATSTGGGAGTGSAGGAGGTTTVNGRLTDTGGAGTAGAGGNAGQYGGAGGGGLFGGGSGARTGTTFDDSGSTDYVSAGGGGGGSSLVPTGGSTALVGDPASITITYTVADTTPPVIVPTVSGTLGGSGWYTSDVGVTWSVTDPEVPISSSTGCDPSTVTTDTTGVTLTCTATSLGGSASKDVTIERDTAGPVLSITGGPADTGSYPTGAVPTAPSCTATDTVSGPATQACTITGYSTATGPHTLTFTATDVAGNITTATRSYTVLAPQPAAITAASGGGQSATVGSAFTAAVVATVTDTASAPLQGAPVTFTVAAGSLTFPGGAKTAQVATDASGRATSPAITAGATTGTATITASTPGVTGTASFTETVTAAKADLSATVTAPASAAKGASFPIVLTISNAGPSPASTIGSGITLPSGLTITNGGSGAVTSNKQSVGFLTATLAPGASVTYTITVKATAKGTQTIVGGVLSVRIPDPQPANNLRTVRTTIT